MTKLFTYDLMCFETRLERFVADNYASALKYCVRRYGQMHTGYIIKPVLTLC